MGRDYHAVLLDTVSIQRYIFSSNKLKENAGASLLVREIFREPLRQAIGDAYGIKDFDLDLWKKYPDNPVQEEIEIGYMAW